MTEIYRNKAQKNDEPANLTRRSFFDRVMLTAAGGAALIIAGTRRAEAKVSKLTAKYRGSPRSGKKCSGCTHYRGGGKCALVSGSVSGNGYCNYYSRKKSGYTY